MRSMTGYGYWEYACDRFIMTGELKSYNNRYLELNYYSPSALSGFEARANEILKDHASRGHIDLSFKLKTLKGDLDVILDEDAALSYIRAAKDVENLMRKNGLGVSSIRADKIMAMEGVLSSNSSSGPELYEKAFETCMENIMAQFDAAKDREGLATKNDLTEKIDSIEASLEVVRSHADELEAMLRKTLVDKINEYLSDQNYDESRILTEVAIQLMRYTVNEETVRLAAHIREFRRLLESSEPVGKRMDFLCQEMNREINTIGSKSQIVEINFEVVNMKDCLENIREQVRNIE